MVAMKPYEGLSETGGESNFQKASKPSHEQKAVLANGFIKNRRRHQRQKKNWQRSIKQIMNGGMAMSSYKDYKKEHCRIQR